MTSNSDLLISVLLWSPGCPVGGALSLHSVAPPPLLICPPSTSTSNQSAALPSTCPHPPLRLCTTCDRLLQSATWIRLVVHHRKDSRPTEQKNFPKAVTHRRRRRLDSQWGHQRWLTAGTDSWLLQDGHRLSHPPLTSLTVTHVPP